jgi:pimeloyl-[acyl-carrier protein] synthase
MADERDEGARRDPGILSPETFADPYPFAHHLRETDPVHWSEEFNAWVLTRYYDVAACLHDPRLAADRITHLDRLAQMGMERLRPLFGTMRKMLLYLGPSDHARVRGLVNQTFTRRNVEGWRAETQQLVDHLLNRVETAETMDVLRDLAQPLPLAVIAMVLGIPSDAHARLKGWSDALAPFFGNFTHTGHQLAAAQRCVLDFSDYLRGIIEEKRRGTGLGRDLLTSLVHDGGGALTDDELVANAILLVGAGHVTTTDLIGNGTLALLRHPAQANRVGESRSGSGFLEGAIEELLRYDGPVQMTARLAREDIEIGGKLLGKGRWVILWLGAANRDPARFAEPDGLDLGRTDNRHLAFGSGAHFCLGAPLARLQAQIAIGTLFRRFPGMRLMDGPLSWERNPTLRGLISLPVTLFPRSA